MEEPARFPQGIPLVLNTETTLLEALVGIPQTSRPYDDVRALAAAGMTELACMFTVLHEVGHAACGHTRFSELRLAGEPVSEFMALSDLIRRRRFLRQVWEMEADLIAAMLLVRWIMGPEPNRVFLSEVFGVEEQARYQYDAVAAALAGLYVLFLYMNQRERARGWFRSHPPPLVRITYVHNAVRLFAQRDFQMDMRELDRRVDEANDPLNHMSLLVRQRERLSRLYDEFAWLPAGSWRRAEDDFYSYNLFRALG
jgi:hypothetical protein